MKIRNGFISNSSTTSFCIYGARLHYNKVANNEVLGKVINDNPNKVQEVLDKWNDDPIWYHIYISEFDRAKENENFGEVGPFLTRVLMQHIFDGLEIFVDNDRLFIGRSWDKIGDNETGAEFKQSIHDALDKIMGEEVECNSWFEETSY